MPVQWPNQPSQSGSNFLPQGRPDNFVVEQPYHSASVDDLYQGRTTMVAGTREALSERQYYSYTLPGEFCCVWLVSTYTYNQICVFSDLCMYLDNVYSTQNDN